MVLTEVFHLVNLKQLPMVLTEVLGFTLLRQIVPQL